MRLPILLIAALLTGCVGGSGPAAKSTDPTTQKWYGDTVEELANLNRGIRELIKRHKPDDAAALIQRGEPISAHLLSVARPTLAATEAASDLDELYAQMLFSNRNYGWARLMYQKNLARWKYWKPQTAETEARLKQVQSEITACDREIEGGTP